MYCKYCGKPLSDGARFCGFCGKNQDTIKRKLGESYCSIKNRAYTVVSFLLQAAIIILSITDVIKISFGDEFFKQILLLNVFDFFDGASYIKDLGSLAPELRTLSNYAFTAGILVIASISACIIYFIYVIMVYLPNIQMKNKCRFGIECYKYSVVPNLIYVLAVTFILFFVSSKAGEIISVLPSNKMIAIYILVGIQFIGNIIFTNIDKPALDTNETDQLISNEEPTNPVYIGLKIMGIALAIIIFVLLNLWLHIF